MTWLWALVACQPEIQNVDFVSLEAGSGHLCGVRTDNTLHCWGGQAADRVPAEVRGVASVGVGYVATCVVFTDDSAECYGGNETEDQIPDGEWLSIAPGRSTSCGVQTDGSLTCWGAADGDDAPPTGAHSGELASGAGVFAALRDDGGLSNWGTYAVDPPTVPLTQLSAGYRELCGLDGEGAIHCWADQAVDQGDAAPTLEHPTLGGFSKVAAGYGHGCALDGDAMVRCWGEGTGREAEGEGPYDDLAAGDGFTCGLLPDRTVECWGNQSPPR